MFQIDTPDAATALPTPAPAGTPGYFTLGDPTTGQLATDLPADWLNMVQQELLAIVVAASITPSKTNSAQVLAAINTLIAASITALHLGTAATHAAGDFDAAGAAAAALTSAETFTGSAIAALDLGTASMHAAGDFEASGTAAGLLAAFSPNTQNVRMGTAAVVFAGSTSFVNQVVNFSSAFANACDGVIAITDTNVTFNTTSSGVNFVVATPKSLLSAGHFTARVDTNSGGTPTGTVNIFYIAWGH